MAKNPKRPNTRIAPELLEEKPVVPVFRPLVMEERDKLISILNDPVFVKAWSNAEQLKPSVFPSMPEKFEGEFGAHHAASALHRIQGWEMHKAALVKQTLEVIPRRKANPEEYPDAGKLESEIARNLPNPPKK